MIATASAVEIVFLFHSLFYVKLQETRNVPEIFHFPQNASMHNVI